MSREKQKAAIVTGGSKGIGLGIAKELATQGYAVILTSRNLEYAKSIAQEISNEGGTCLGVAFDLEDHTAIGPLISSAIENFGQLDVLVNNAISHHCLIPIDACDHAAIDSAFRVNITNTLALTRAAYPHLKQTQGNVINIGSVVINRHLLGVPLYTIVKGAIDQMTKVLAAEWAKDSVRVNAINPGFIETSAFADLGMTEDQVKAAYDFFQTNYVPLNKIGQPEDVAKLAAYLASESAELITGSTFDIDGGYSHQGLSLYGADQ